MHLDDGALVEALGSPHTRTTHRDVPLSFDPERREYGWREVAHHHVEVHNDDPAPDRVARPQHDPMTALGGA